MLSPAFLEIPVSCRLVEPVEGVLDDDRPPSRHEQALQLRERATEVGNVVQRPARDDRVEARRVGEFLERYGLEDRPLGRGRIDRDDPVAEIVRRSRESAIAASDLEYPRRSGWQLGCHKFEDVHLRATSSSSAPT